MITCTQDISKEIAKKYRDSDLTTTGYRFLATSVAVKSNCPGLTDLLDSIYRSFRLNLPADDSITMYLLEEDGSGERYATVDPGFDSFRCSDHSRAVSFWGAQLICNHLYRSGCLFLHASALERDGRALIFTGKSRSGKTTLTLSLRREGFTFFSDEFAPLDLATGAVHPFPRSFLLRDDCLDLLVIRDRERTELPFFYDHQERIPGDPLPPKRFIISPEEVFPSIGQAPAEPGAIFFLTGFSKKDTLINPLPAARALEMILDDSVNNVYLDSSQGEEALTTLVLMLTRIPAFTIRPGPRSEEPERRAEVLERAIANGEALRIADLEKVAHRCRELMKIDKK